MLRITAARRCHRQQQTKQGKKDKVVIKTVEAISKGGGVDKGEGLERASFIFNTISQTH